MSGRSTPGAAAPAPAATRLDAARRRASLAIAVIDDRGAIATATAEFGRLVGVSPADLRGRALTDLVHPDDAAMALAVTSGAVQVGALCLCCPSGCATVGVAIDDLRLDPEVNGLVLTAQPTQAGWPDRHANPPRELIVGGFPAYAYRVVLGDAGWTFEGSPRLRELTGRADPTIGPAERLDLIHPQDRERFAAEDERTNRTGEPFALEYNILRPDGGVRRVRDESFPDIDRHGRVVAWTGIMVDVTAGAAARPGDPEARARRLLDRLPVAVYEQNLAADGREHGSFINRRMEELLGFGGAEWEPTWQMWENLIHPDDRAAVVAAEHRCDATGEPFRMEYRMRARDGRTVWIRDEAVQSASFDDGRQVWHGAMIDITEEVASRQALTASEARFRALVRHSHDLIAVLDADGTVAYISPSAHRLLGAPPDALLGGNLLDLVHPDDADAAVAALRGCLATGEPTPRLLVRLRRTDGVWRTFETTKTSLTDDPAVRGIVVNARDVSARIAAERSLRESESRFQRFLDRTPVLAVLSDADGRCVWANEQARRWFGVDPAGLVGKRAEDWLPSAVADAIRERNDRVLASGQAIECEVRLAAADGSVLELLSIAFPASGPDGEPMVGEVAVDVADRRRAAETGRLLAAMVESADEAIVSRTLDGTILSWNPGAERLYGFSAAEAVGSSLSMLTPPDYEDEVAAATARARAGERVGPIETRRRHKDGRLLDIAFTLAPVRDESGAAVAIVAVARDFSEPKRVRDALRTANEDLERRVAARTSQLSTLNVRLTQNLTELERTQEASRHRAAALRQQAQLLDLANDAIVVTDLVGTIRFWNPAAERLYGWTEAEALDATAEALLAPAYPEPFAHILARLDRQGGWEGEVEHARKDGSRIVVESRWAVQRDERGQPSAVVTINRDVTDRARIARERAELAKAARTHARRVEELAELKDDFTAIVAHELVSPVAAIRWFAEVLAMEGLSAEERDHALATIRAETDLLHVMVDDVRAIAKVDRDDYSVAPRPVELGDVVRAAEAFTRSLSGSHPFAVEGRLEGRVLADPARIGQVLRNLLGNAAKYTPAGTPISLRVRKRNGRVRIEVADDGPGIDPDEAAVIFEKYRRGRQTGRRHVAGAGIGLYVSRRIVRAHGSDLELRSRAGTGSTFSFELERAE